MQAPADAELIDLGGLHVYPGTIAANTGLGLAEIGAVRATLDQTESGCINPNARTLGTVNADSDMIPVTRASGVLAAQTVPLAGPASLVAGT